MIAEISWSTEYTVMLFAMCVQVLSQVTPNPNDVKREVALHHPDKNRSADFLPRESQQTNYDHY